LLSRYLLILGFFLLYVPSSDLCLPLETLITFVRHQNIS
jgi:hypothetical protein